MLKHLVAFFTAFIVVWLGTPWLRRLALWLQAVDEPEPRRVNETPMPRLGGLGICLGALLGPVVAALVDPIAANLLVRTWPGWVALVAAALLVTAIGAIDDIRPVPAFVKLTFQIVVAVIVVFAGYTVHDVAIPFVGVVELGYLAVPFTLAWVIGVTNAINLVDGLDGLATGVALIASATLFAATAFLDRPDVALMCAALVGATAAFLRYNFHPASIFLGDSGSLFLGFALSVLAIAGGLKGTTTVALMVPFLALGLPLMDTILTIVRRMLRSLRVGRRSPAEDRYAFFWTGRMALFTADREHIHHKMLERGLSHRAAVMVLYGVCAALGALGFVSLLLTGAPLVLVVTSVALATFIALRRLGYQETRVLGRGLLLPLLERSGHRFLLPVLGDLAFVGLAYYGAHWIGATAHNWQAQRAIMVRTAPVALIITLGVFSLGGTYRGDYRHPGLADVLRLVRTVAVATAALWVGRWAFGLAARHDLSTAVINFYFLGTLAIGSRIAFRILEDLYLAEPDGRAPALIYGAGRAGAVAVKEFLSNALLDLHPIGFVDDDPRLAGAYLDGLPVYGGLADLPRLIGDLGVGAIIIASNDIPQAHVEAVRSLCEAHSVRLSRFSMRVESVAAQGA